MVWDEGESFLRDLVKGVTVFFMGQTRLSASNTRITVLVDPLGPFV